MKNLEVNYLELLSNYQWEVETWTQEMDKPAESGVLAMVVCGELSRRILTRLTQLDIRESQFWDEEWLQVRDILVPVVEVGMKVEPVIRKDPRIEDRDLIPYLIGFRPKMGE